MTRIRFVFLLLWVSWGVNAQQTEKIQFASLPENWLENDALFQQVLPVDDQWWMVFEDATLDSLISLAVERNPSVLMAINRMDMAKANLGIARSAFYPTIDLNAGWTRQQSSGHMGTGNPQGWNSNFQTSLDMSWQVDVFGNIRMKAKAQKENYAATREEYNAAMVSLCAQVAQTYFNLREMPSARPLFS